MHMEYLDADYVGIVLVAMFSIVDHMEMMLLKMMFVDGVSHHNATCAAAIEVARQALDTVKKPP